MGFVEDSVIVFVSQVSGISNFGEEMQFQTVAFFVAGYIFRRRMDVFQSSALQEL